MIRANHGTYVRHLWIGFLQRVLKTDYGILLRFFDGFEILLDPRCCDCVSSIADEVLFLGRLLSASCGCSFSLFLEYFELATEPEL